MAKQIKKQGGNGKAANKMTKTYPIQNDSRTSAMAKNKKTMDSLKKAGWNPDVNSVRRKMGTDSFQVNYYKKSNR